MIVPVPRLRVLPIAIALAVTLGACSGGEPEPKAAASPTEVRPSETASPTPVDLDAIGLSFLEAVQARLDEAIRPGAVELAPIGVDEIAPYGPVLMLKIVETELKDGEVGVVTLVAMAVEAGEVRRNLTLADISFLAFEDPSGGRAYADVVDLLAYADGEIGVNKLRNRLIFDF